MHSRLTRGMIKGSLIGLTVLAGLTGGLTGALGKTDAAPGTITSIAGGVGGPGPGLDVGISIENGQLAFGRGDLYIADFSAIRAVDAKTGALTTPVGAVNSDTGRNGGLATSFPISADGIMVDGAGNLLLSTSGELRVAARATGTFYGHAMLKGHVYAVAKLPKGASARTIDAHGNIVLTDPSGNQILVLALRSGTFYGQPMVAGRAYPVAGTGKPGRTGDGGPALKAQLYSPAGVAIDHHGNLVIADTINSRIRVVAQNAGQFYGQRMRKGDIYTIVDKNGSWFHGGFGGDGGPALLARISRPTNAAIDRAGNVLISDTNNWRVRVDAAQSGTFYGRAMVAGHIYTLAGEGNTVESAPDGGLAVRTRMLPGSVTIDGSGNLVIGDTDQVQVVPGQAGTYYGRPMQLGHIYRVAGFPPSSSRLIQDGWLAGRAQIGGQDALAVDSNGSIIATGSETDEVSVVAGRTGIFYGRPMIAGHYYLIAGGGAFETTPENGAPALTAGFAPYGVAVDQAGNVVLTDLSFDLIRVIADSSGTFYGQPMTAGHIYTIAGGGTGSPGSGDGGPATQAAFRFPWQLTIDGAGNVIFADAGDNRIRLVAASTGQFYGQDMTAGDIYTIAGSGGPGTSPDGTVAVNANLAVSELALDNLGNLVITDGQLVRVIAAQPGTFYGKAMLAGRVYTVAGGGTAGLGDGGPAVKAQLTFGSSIAVDAQGNIIIPGAQRVRVVAATDGTFYGVPMTADHIYTVAGTGVRGFSGDGGPANKAKLEDPQSAAVDAAGDLIIGDGPRIRQLTK